MRLSQLSQRLFGRKSSARQRKHAAPNRSFLQRSLGLEPLEDRRLLSVFNMPVGLTSLETVPVGDPGNVGELSGQSVSNGGGPDRICGAVAYDYQIGKYEVTAAQYTEFLNAVAGVDAYALYNTQMASTYAGSGITRSGGGTVDSPYTYSVVPAFANRPVNYVSWGDAARFSNWLHNGQPTGPQGASTTEDGAYSLNGATSQAALLAVTRKSGWEWAIASEDEWYKAAYYKGGSTNAGYWDYATQSNSVPGKNMTEATNPGNNVNYSVVSPFPIDGDKLTTIVGEFQLSDSAYGTFDQNGNVFEWTEAITESPYRGLRGGYYGGQWRDLIAGMRYGNYPTWEDSAFGFRVVAASSIADLVVTKSHSGDFQQGNAGSSYTIVVSNAGTGPTSGTVSLVDLLPAGLTATAFSGAGWTTNLSTLTATRSDSLAAGASYPALTLTVQVSDVAPASVTNTVTVSGGGELNTANNTASDPTEILGVLPTVSPITASINSGTVEAGSQILALQFSEDVMGAGASANYELREAGTDGLLGTSDDLIRALDVCYRNKTATLSMAALPEGIYRLTVRDAITDLGGTKLDGDGDNAAGGNWVRDFVVTPSDRLFDGTPSYPSGGSTPQAVATSDFNSDGITDIVVANGSNVAVLLGDGMGGFSDPITSSMGVTSSISLAVGDFNGDGKSDVVVANYGDGTVGLLLGNGAGGFASAATFSCGGVGADNEAVAVADFNGDGKDDVVVANGFGNTVGVLFGDGAGGLGPVTRYVTSDSHVYAVAVGDFNRDGKPDIVVGSGNLSILVNDGSGGFTRAVVYDDPVAITSVVIGDFNGDSTSDLAFGIDTDIGFLFGNGSGGFGELSMLRGFPGIGRAESLLAADFNGDGKIDLAAGAGCVCVALNEGGGSFAAPTNLGVGAMPNYLAMGDFNADGKIDLVAANRGSDSIGVLLGIGDGSFHATTLLWNSGGIVNRLATADFNGDGQLDLAVADYGSSGVSVFLANGSGGFASPRKFSIGREGYRLAVGDFNGDGKDDLVVADFSFSGGTASVLLGNGAGDFGAPIAFSTGGNCPFGIAVEDFNGDGKSDLAIINAESDNVVVFLGNGDGSFGASTTLSTGNSSARSVAAGDFNGDGDVDLVLSTVDELLLFLGDGAGGFAAGQAVNGGGASEALVARDLNGDNRLDLLAVNRPHNSVALVLNNGIGGFAVPINFSTGVFCPNAVTFGDYNRDGRTDIALSTDYGAVSVLLGNGIASFAAPIVFAAGSLTARDIVAGDFTNDGQVDLVVANGGNDGLTLLSNIYGPSPATLTTVSGMTFDIATGNFGSGELIQGTNNAFDGDGRLIVGGTAYRPTLLNATTDDGGRTVVTGAGTVAGLTVTREITVPNTGSQDFARTVDSFTNPTGSAITTTVTVVGNLGSDAATRVFMTSDGDTIVEATDQWIGTDDADGSGTPAVIHYIHGPLGLQPVSVDVIGDNIVWTYNITVAPGQTLRLASFTIVGETEAETVAAANALVAHTGFGGQAAAFLDASERASLQNFQFGAAATTTTALVASPNPSTIGQSVTFTATVTADTGTASPTGTVTFKDGTTVLGAGTVSGGVATFTTTTLAAGDHSVTAVYEGAADFVGSTSASLSMTVIDLPPTVVSTTPSLTGGTLAAGTTTLSVNFSEAVLGGATAANYELRSVGSDGLLGTADDTIVPVTASYSGTTTTLTFAALPESVYRLTVRDAITDASGNRLDGNGDGTAGGNYITDFVITAPTGGVSFAAPVTFDYGGVEPGGWKCAVADTDFNRDGNRDLVSVSYYGVYVLLGNGQGGFTTSTAKSRDGTIGGVAVGDFNQDGNVDIVTGQYGGSSVYVLLGDGQGGFPRTVETKVTNNYTCYLTTDDFNRDGLLDVALVHYGNPTVSVLLGTGTGAFTLDSVFSSGGSLPMAIAAGDLNSDGISDLAVGHWAPGSNLASLTVFFGDGSGDFSAPTSLLSGLGSESVLIEDLNADGKNDIAIPNSGSRKVYVLLGNGDGEFAAPKVFSTGSNPPVNAESLSSADFNSDGNLDLVVANFFGTTVSLLLGDGTGEFSSPITMESGGEGPDALALADFNNDGRCDIAVGNSDSTLSLLVNTTAPPTMGLISPNGFSFDITDRIFGAGQLIQGTDNAFDGLNRLQVGGTDFSPVSGSATLVDNGRSVVIASQVVEGLTVSREITVPNTGSQDFARTVDSFTNPTGSAITTTVTIVGNLGSDGATRVFRTSDGDTIVEATDKWIGTDDADGSDTPAVIHYIHGPAGLQPVSVNVIGDNVVWTYNITVAPGQTLRLANFTIVGATEAETVAAADALVTHTGFGGQAAAFLDASELASLQNFQFYPVATTTTVIASPYPSVYGQSVTFTATVSPNIPGESTPTGTVTFKDGTSVLGAGTLSNGTATFTTTTLTPGSHSITAVYEGNAEFGGSTSAGVSQLVNAPDLTVRVTHWGDFREGDTQGDSYSIIVGNRGTAATSGTVSLVDLLPSCMTAKSFSGSGWTVDMATLTATRSDSLAAGSSYPTLTLTISISGDAPSSVTNVITVSGGGEADTSNNTANYATTIPDNTPMRLVHTSPSLDGGTLAPGTATLSVIFDRQIAGTTSAADFELRSVGADELLGTDDDRIVPVSVSCSGRMANLAFAGLPESVYRLTVRDTITSGSGMPLDGDGDGAVGGDWSADFVVAPNSTLLALTGTYDFSGSRPDHIASGDFNGDGILDLAVTNAELSGTVEILLGDGLGGFTTTGNCSTGGSMPENIAVGDFDGDGNLDLIIANNYSSKVAILRGNGNGTFSTDLRSCSVGIYPHGLVVADFDEDGDLDAATTSWTDDTICILLNDGSGGFAKTTVASGGEWPWGMAAADFNRDGTVDLVFANRFGRTVGILLGNGNGRFETAMSYDVGGTLPEEVAVGDFNGDGNIDVVVSDSSAATMGIFLGRGDGTLGAITRFTPGPLQADQMAVVDINGDGKLDLAVQGGGLANVGVLLGDGAGGFAAAVTYNASSQPADGIVAGDFNGDGRPDLAVTSRFDGTVGILLNVYSSDAIPVVLTSASGLTFDVAVGSYGVGELIQGNDNAFDGDGRLLIGGVLFQSDNTTHSIDDGGRTVVTGTGTVVGLTVHREVTVPATGSQDFARTVDSFTNSTGSSITTTVTVVGNLGSDAATRVFMTSDGDTIVEATDQWIGTDDADGSGTPAVIHYIHGPLGLKPASVNVIGDNIVWTYNITVGAGQTLRLANFTIVGATEVGAIAAADALATRTGFGGQAATYLTATELASLGNFVFYPVATTMTVTAAPSPSVYGQAVTFTAIVSSNISGAGTPSGAVTFGDGATVLGTATLDANGRATFTTSTLNAGTHSITASYGGDSSFIVGVSVPLSYTVTRASLTVTADNQTKVYGAAVPTLTASYSGFVNGDTAASLTTPPTLTTMATAASNVGTYAIKANGAANPNYAITYVVGTLTVTPAVLTVTADNKLKVVNGPVPALTYTVAGLVGSDTLLTEPTLSTAATSTSPIGAYAITAAGAAASADYTIDYAAGTLTVIPPQAPSVVVVASPSPSSLGQSVTFTTTVSALAGLPTPTGEILFLRDGRIRLGTARLDSAGQASFTMSSLTVGAHTITAEYRGDATNLTASGSVSHEVKTAVTATVVTASPSPSEFGRSVTFTATVSSPQGLGRTTGSVIFTIDGVVVATVNANSAGKSRYVARLLDAGSHIVTATYSGNTKCTGSSGQMSHTVNRATTAVSVRTTVGHLDFGDPLTITARVTAKLSGAGTPVGTVTFSDGGVVLGTATLDADGRASFTTSALTAGKHTITVSYSGAANYLESVGTIAKSIDVARTVANVTASATSAAFGQLVSFACSIATKVSASVPTGMVTIKDANAVLGTATLDASGQCTFSTASLSVGLHRIRVVYNGDANFEGSTSRYVEVRITAAATASSAVRRASTAISTAKVNDLALAAVLNELEETEASSEWIHV